MFHFSFPTFKMFPKEYQVLDQGFIRYVERFGDELTVVNAARVSFGHQKTVLDDADKKLLKYLLRHEHTSPFRHVFFRFHIKAPEFVMRQWFKHVVGSEWSASSSNPLHGWNEISGRYVVLSDIHTPETWRLQSKDRKQGSEGLLDPDQQEKVRDNYRTTLETCLSAYQTMIDAGVAREQARMILPLSMYTECIWTVSLQALIHFVRLRDESHAQEEIREYARIFRDILTEEFPNTLQEKDD